MFAITQRMFAINQRMFAITLKMFATLIDSIIYLLKLSVNNLSVVGRGSS